MADLALAADAIPVAQKRQATITAYDAATSYRVTINGKIVSQIGTGGTATTTATAFATTLNASTIPEFAEITWSSNGAAVIGTADTPGKPFTCTSSVDGGTGTMGAFADTTSNDGPSAITASNFKNVSTGARALPANTDTLTLEALAVALKWNLDATAAVALTRLDIEASYTGQIGLAPTNADGNVAYDDYRQQYWQISATTLVIGAGEGEGSPLLLLDTVNTACNLRIVKTASDGALAGLAPVIWKGNNGGNTVLVESGSLDIAPFAAEQTQVLTLTAIGDSVVTTWGGVILTTVNAGGSATIDITSVAALADITTINIYDQATVILRGDNPATTVNVFGSQAKFDLRSSGTIGTCNLIDGPTLEVGNNPSAVTITTLNGSGTPTINDPNSRLTVTNAVGANNSDVFDWEWNLKPGRQITLGAP